jgi:hypothetical protein
MENESEVVASDETKGTETSSSPDAKQGAVSIPAVDDKGVAYFERYKELERKMKDFEGVDVKRWNELQELDIKDLQEAASLRDKIVSDRAKFNKIMEILDAEEEAAEEDGEKPQVDKKLLKTVQGLQERLDARERQEQEAAQKNWMTRYDQSIESSVSKAVAETHKDLGSLSAFEQRAIAQFVDDAFSKDRASKAPKLSLESVPGIVQEGLKAIRENRDHVRIKSRSFPGSDGGGWTRRISET